jgi:hypothetical protein
MMFSSVFPIVVLIALSAVMLLLVLKPDLKIRPATLVAVSVSFLIFSVVVIVREGPFGFWTEHTRNLWGNQIWLDLLLLASACWFLLMPRASRLKMHSVLWLLLVLSSGSVGLLLMISRVLYLEDKERKITLRANDDQLHSAHEAVHQ